MTCEELSGGLFGVVSDSVKNWWGGQSHYLVFREELEKIKRL